MTFKPGQEVDFLTLKATVKAVGDDSGPGEFEAILSTEAVDRDGESIKAGAFEPLPKSIPIFYQHDWRDGAMPVGSGEPYYDGKDLKVRGVFASTPRAQEIRSLVADGHVGAMSVGFLNATRNQKSVTKGDLFESSFTAIPVNPTATVLSAKDLAYLDARRAILTPDEVRAMEDLAPTEKAGARNSASDMAMIQQMHDAAVSLGASCDAPQKSVDGEQPTEDTKAVEADGETSTDSTAAAAADEAAAAAAEQDELELRARLLSITTLADTA